MSSYNKNQPETIRTMFGSIAQQYDKANAILSFQMHKRWNDALVKHALTPSQPKILLDLCCGTGDIAYHYLKKQKSPIQVYMLDFCKEMLECAQAKAQNLGLQQHSISYLQADAQSIPLEDCSVDCATIAYGIRNVKNPRICIAEVYRTLRSSGKFGILELTQPENSLLRFGHKLYLQTVLPVMGKFVAYNREAYEYLCNSIQSFVLPREIEAMLKDEGFVDTHRIPLMGGIATIISGTKK